jgi:hypothetical protein
MQTLGRASMGGQQARVLSLAGGRARRAKSGLVAGCEGEGDDTRKPEGQGRPAEMTWLSLAWADQLGTNASQEDAEGRPVIKLL